MDNEKKFTYYSRIVMMIIMTFEFILNLIFIITIVEVKDNKYEKDCVNYNNNYNSYYNSYNSYNDYDYDYDYYNYNYGNDYDNDNYNYPSSSQSKKIKEENDVFVLHYRGISTSFSFFFISYFIFFIEFLAYFTCEDCHYILDFILRELNHLILLITFFIGQFLYLIDCMIIPVFYQRITKLNYFYYSIFCDENETKIIKKKINDKYTLLITLCFVFLLLILFLDFIVLNLYKGICCRMEQICNTTQDCCENFGRGFVNKLGILCCKTKKDTGIVKLEDLENENDRQIHILTGDIRHLLAQNVELSTKDI